MLVWWWQEEGGDEKEGGKSADVSGGDAEMQTDSAQRDVSLGGGWLNAGGAWSFATDNSLSLGGNLKLSYLSKEIQIADETPEYIEVSSEKDPEDCRIC